MYIHTLMSIKNGGRESFGSMKEKHPDSRTDAAISALVA